MALCLPFSKLRVVDVPNPAFRGKIFKPWHHVPSLRMPLERYAVYVRSSNDAQEPEKEPGDSAIQDTLVNMLKLEIGKKQVEVYVEESSEKLKQIAENAKEEMDKLAEINRLRSDVAFDSAMADINLEVDEFEEQLRKSREEQEAKDKEFNEWEKGVAESRSEGHFFKSLYRPPENKSVRGVGNDGKDDNDNKDDASARAKNAMNAVRIEETTSPLRMYLFLGLSFILIADVGADISSADPSLGPDVLYTGLAALAVWLAMNERKN